MGFKKGNIAWNKLGSIEKSCVVCNKSFIVIGQRNYRNKKTCSQECRYKLVSSIFSQKIEKICSHCGKLFKIVPSQRERLKHCSYKCYADSMRGQTRPKEWYKSHRGRIPWNKGLKGVYSVNAGEKNGQWKGGIYNTNKALRSSPAYKKWSKAVKKRDNYTCQDCGQMGVELEACHIKPFASCPEIRFELDNGKALCVSCHSEFDNMRRKTIQAV